MITYTWTINKLECKKKENELENIVFNCFYTRTATETKNNQTYTATISSNVFFETLESLSNKLLYINDEIEIVDNNISIIENNINNSENEEEINNLQIVLQGLQNELVELENKKSIIEEKIVLYNENFVPYENLTKEILEDWLESQLDVQSIDNNLTLSVQNQIEPPIITLPLPF